MSDPALAIPFRVALRVWWRVALHSFGGPAGQIAFMHRILVEEERWLSERRFLHALNYCMILPGPEAMQLATYVGWLMHGLRGGLVAGGLFVLPGFVSILVLSALYATYQDTSWLEALFFGLKAAVLAVVVEAVVRIGRRGLRNAFLVGLAAAAFVAIFFFAVPFPLIVVGAGVLGWLVGRRAPGLFAHVTHRDAVRDAGPPPILPDDALPRERPDRRATVRRAGAWLLVWWVPVALLFAGFGAGHVLVQEAWFFSKVSVVTFGGAYAVLAYVAQRAVEGFGWLLPGEMLDGLGLAETTPGPLIQVVQFVGFLGAFRDPGPFDPLTAGILASIVVTWVTFVPCFLWIFVGAPYIEHLRGRHGLSHALAAITAAVVGVILNLAVWFSLHVLFAGLDERTYFHVVQVLVPEWGTLNVAALLIAAGAFVAMMRFRWGMLSTLAVATAVGVLVQLVR